MIWPKMEYFNIISTKWVKSMNQLTKDEVDLIKKYLLKIMDLEANDFFSDDDDWLTDDIRIIYWQWQDKVLMDMVGFPGDNEDGCVFLNGEIIILNGDGDLNFTEECPNNLDVKILEHLRPNGDFHCKKKHDHCIKQHLNYCKLMNRNCQCEVCQ